MKNKPQQPATQQQTGRDVARQPQQQQQQQQQQRRPAGFGTKRSVAPTDPLEAADAKAALLAKQRSSQSGDNPLHNTTGAHAGKRGLSGSVRPLPQVGVGRSKTAVRRSDARRHNHHRAGGPVQHKEDRGVSTWGRLVREECRILHGILRGARRDASLRHLRFHAEGVRCLRLLGRLLGPFTLGYLVAAAPSRTRKAPAQASACRPAVRPPSASADADAAASSSIKTHATHQSGMPGDKGKPESSSHKGAGKRRRVSPVLTSSLPAPLIRRALLLRLLRAGAVAAAEVHLERVNTVPVCLALLGAYARLHALLSTAAEAAGGLLDTAAPPAVRSAFTVPVTADRDAASNDTPDDDSARPPPQPTVNEVPLNTHLTLIVSRAVGAGKLLQGAAVTGGEQGDGAASGVFGTWMLSL